MPCKAIFITVFLETALVVIALVFNAKRPIAVIHQFKRSKHTSEGLKVPSTGQRINWGCWTAKVQLKLDV